MSLSIWLLICFTRSSTHVFVTSSRSREMMTSSTLSGSQEKVLLGQERAYRGRWSVAFRQLRNRPGAMIGAIIVLLFVLIALFAPLLAPFDPNEISRNRRAAP